MKLNFPWQKIQLIRAAQDFAALRLWDTYDNLDFFVVETPLEEPVVACIMGAGGSEYGLCVFRGPDAFEQPYLLSQGQDALLQKGNTLGFSMERYGNMNHDIKKWYKGCNFRAKKDDWLPEFLIVHNRIVEFPEKTHDIKLLLYILKGIIAAETSGRFDPSTTGHAGSEMLTLQTSGDAEKPAVQVTQKAFDGSKELLAYCNRDEMFEEVLPGDIHSALPFEDPDIDLSVVPKADDLEGWKAVSAAQTRLFIDFWNESDNLRKSRPSNQFFGDSEWDYYVEEYGNMLSLPSYVTWAALCYRARQKDLTHVEKLLGGDLPAALRLILEALQASYPSLYQIEKTDAKAGTLVLKDLLLAGRVTVHDRGFAGTAKPGLIMPLRITKVGSFSFIDIAGPVFGPMEAVEVLEELRSLKLPAKPTAAWLREHASIFGRLWQYFDETQEFRQAVPGMVNTEGDTLEFITARFGYSDPLAVRRALKKHPEIDYDDADDVFVWFKESDNPSPMGDTTLLGRIFFEDGFIMAEVNSENRYKRLRHLLEEIGLVYHQHESKSVEAMLEQAERAPDGEADSVADEELPEAVKAAARQQMTAYYMDWLDKPVPALDNNTPRQAAKTAKGAQKVKLLIETIPSPNNKVGIDVPKKQMLRALGLEERL